MKITSILINSNTVEEIQNKSFHFTDRINERTSCSFVVISPTFNIDIGMEIEVYADGTKFFAGTIDSYNLFGDFDNHYRVSAVDYSQSIDRRLVIEAFTNETAGQIAKNMIANVFSDEGVTEGVIDDGPVIKGSVFNYLDGNMSMNLLAEATGYIWYIDANKQLHFRGPSTNYASVELTDTLNNYNSISINKKRANYRNKHYTKTGLIPTGTMPKETPSPKPDGSSRTFTVQLPIAKRPEIFINGVRVSSTDIGISGLDVNKKWYFSYNSNTVTQDRDEPVLGEGAILEVRYQGLISTIVYSEDDEEITARQLVEGGSGIYESIDEQRRIGDEESGMEHTLAMLRKFGKLPLDISLRTFETSLRAGQLVKIVNTQKSIDDFYLVEQVTGRGDAYNLQFDVKALDGEAVGNWTNFFKNLVRTTKDITIRPDEVLIRVHEISESLSIDEEMEYEIFNCPIPNTTLYPSVSLYPC